MYATARGWEWTVMHVGRAQSALSVARILATRGRSLRTSEVGLLWPGRVNARMSQTISAGSLAPASPVGFSKVMPTSAESQRQWLQYRKKGGSPAVLRTEGKRPSPLSGGSDGTTVRVFLQLGHMKQFRAQLRFPSG